jgi:hypothetical protein
MNARYKAAVAAVMAMRITSKLEKGVDGLHTWVGLETFAVTNGGLLTRGKSTKGFRMPCQLRGLSQSTSGLASK